MSFHISMSGLTAASKDLGVIGNNIANVNTAGFKGSRSEFSSVYNGQQPGGVQVASISQNFDQTGNIVGTGRSLDLAIGGSGFFVLNDGAGNTQYSRAGMFQMNSNGFIVSSDGAKLQGYPADVNGNVMNGVITDLTVGTDSLKAQSTDKVDFTANLNAGASIVDGVTNPFDPTNPDSYTSSYATTIFDSLGNEHTVEQYFVKTADNSWDVHAVVNGTLESSNALSFDTDGALIAGQTYSVPFNPPGATPMTIDVNFDGTTQYGSDYIVTKNSTNGYTSGEYTGLRIDDDGSVFATYSNGQSQLQGQVVLADFTAPQGLQQVSGTGWVATSASGQPLVGAAGTGTYGEIYSGSIESSNVDLTESLVNLMDTNQYFTANMKAVNTIMETSRTVIQQL
ncbi:flagellar hook protein FlgE [Vibrio breoganii]